MSMNFKNIDWNHVTKFSQLVAIVLFVAVFGLGFLLGEKYEYHAFINAQKAQGVTAGQPAPPKEVVFSCDGKKTIEAVFFNGKANLVLSDKRNLVLPQVIAASGARYANADESIVFWNKGDTAFLTEGKATTFVNCAVTPMPQ